MVFRLLTMTTKLPKSSLLRTLGHVCTTIPTLIYPHKNSSSSFSPPLRTYVKHQSTQATHLTPWYTHRYTTRWGGREGGRGGVRFVAYVLIHHGWRGSNNKIKWSPLQRLRTDSFPFNTHHYTNLRSLTLSLESNRLPKRHVHVITQTQRLALHEFTRSQWRWVYVDTTNPYKAPRGA